MLEDIKGNIEKLISLYEAQKQRADSLEEKLASSREEACRYKTQITDLNGQIDNLRLAAAFSGSGDTAEAKARIEKLIREIDQCIKLLEN
ncbi:MAG: hypothetical protein J5871_03015 [Bacteroidales bacterium]|nr:hypothetical protein [Bacteroidales bacterium]